MKIKRIINYIQGIEINFSPLLVNWENQTFSDTRVVMASCHPSDSITWHWAIYANKPKSFKWIFNMGLSISKQKLMYSNN
jgi:hypothetical protein